MQGSANAANNRNSVNKSDIIDMYKINGLR